MLLKPKSERGTEEKTVNVPHPGDQQEGGSHSHTCDLDVEVVVQQQVLGLQVSVDDVAAVTEMDGGHDLLELLPGVFLSHPTVSHQVVCNTHTQP